MMDEITLVKMYSAALQGDKAAINALYQIALQGLPRIQGRSPDSKHQIICDAVWEVLSDATSEEPGAKRWITTDGKVTLSKFAKSVRSVVGDRANRETVRRFLINPEEMSVIVKLYGKKYGLEKE